MSQEEEKGLPQPKPRYVWDPKKLAWVETTEPETQEPVAEKAAVEPKPEEVLEEAKVEAKAEEVTGEAAVKGVPVKGGVEAAGLQYRGAVIRLIAFIVDTIVLLIISYIISRVGGGTATVINGTSSALISTSKWQGWVVVAFFAVYFVGFWAWRGQTLGKMLMGAKIVKTNGRPVGIGRALLRFVVYFLYLILYSLTGRLIVLFLIFFIVFIMIGLDRRKRGIHDLIAGTVVINSRPPKPQPVEVAEPVDATEETAEPPVASEPEPDKTESEK